MPDWLEYIDFSMGCIGFIITIITLKTAASVKRQLIHHAELSDFRESVNNIIQQTDGFIFSINDDKLYLRDQKHTLKRNLIQFFTDIETRFSFLSNSTKKAIKKSLRLLNKQKLSASDWDKIANLLIKFKNSLRKEITYNG